MKHLLWSAAGLCIVALAACVFQGTGAQFPRGPLVGEQPFEFVTSGMQRVPLLFAIARLVR